MTIITITESHIAIRTRRRHPMTMMGTLLIEVILLVVRHNLSFVGVVKYLQAVLEYAR